MTKNGMLRKLSAAAFLLSWFLLPAAGHAAACITTAASLKGWYGMIVSGQTTAASPVAVFLSGAVLFDGVSKLSGSNIYGSAGSRNSVTGTYSVNTDCSLTVDMTVGSSTATYSIGVKLSGEAVGIETDANAVSTISFKPQYKTYTTGLNFTGSSLNGTFAASCGGFLGAYSDVNLVTFSNGTLTGTDPYNNDGSFVVANNPYSGSYTVNSDGTFAGTLVVSGTSFNYYGVISNANSTVDYFYTNVANGVATDAIAACAGGLAPLNAGGTGTLSSQTITFNAIAPQKVGTPLTLSASASSGLPVTFASSTPTVCTVSGDTASFLAAGTCAIVASQAGNATYAAAPSVTQQFAVSAVTVGTFTVSASPAIVFVTPPVCFLSHCAGGSSAKDTVTVKALNGFTGTVSFAVSGLPADVTASFSPTSVTGAGSTQLTLTPGDGTASHKITTVTVTGTSGTVTASAQIILNY